VMPFVRILGGFGFMIGTGGSALVAKTLGENDKERAVGLRREYKIPGAT